MHILPIKTATMMLLEQIKGQTHYDIFSAGIIFNYLVHKMSCILHLV